MENAYSKMSSAGNFRNEALTKVIPLKTVAEHYLLTGGRGTFRLKEHERMTAETPRLRASALRLRIGLSICGREATINSLYSTSAYAEILVSLWGP
jgi:hypothetical protein